MSNLAKSVSRALKDIEYSVRCTKWLTQNRVPSKGERIVIEDSITLTLITWSNILEGRGYPVTHGSLQRWINTNGGSSFEVLLGSLKEADGIILSYIENDLLPVSYDRFKRDLSTVSSHGARAMSLLRPLISQFLLEQEESLFSAVHQCLCFPTRTTPNTKDDVMTQRAIEHFLEVDDRLVFECHPDPYDFFAKNVFDWKWTGIEPYHSDGAVADCLNSLHDKYRHIGYDSLTRYLDTQLSLDIPFSRPQLTRRSKLICVPKSSSKFRTICSEPCALQYYQHGFQRSLVDYVHKHRRLRKRISLNNSTINRDLAWEGSLDGHLSTIDLSDASDSVSWSQLKTWLFGSDLYKACLTSRSKEVLMPDGSVHTLNKFAGMGSSMTFPIECLVFCALTEKGIRDVDGNVDRSVYHVYGDDIVVETQYAKSVIEALIDHGFKPNCDKTFTGCGSLIFRESCGGEFLNGLDVTPVRLPRNFKGYRYRAHLLWEPACIELANACFRGLPKVRHFLIQQLLQMPRHLLPLFDSDGEHSLFSTHATNYRLVRRKRESVTVVKRNKLNPGTFVYPVDYQVDSLRYGSSVTRFVDCEDEEVRLYETLRLINSRTRLVYPEDRVDVEVAAVDGTYWLPTSTTDHYS